MMFKFFSLITALAGKIAGHVGNLFRGSKIAAEAIDLIAAVVNAVIDAEIVGGTGPEKKRAALAAIAAEIKKDTPDWVDTMIDVLVSALNKGRG